MLKYMETISINVEVLDNKLKTIKTISINNSSPVIILELDSLLDLMKKISIYTGIEYYKQCLCDENFECITHLVKMYDKILSVNIKDIISNDNVVDGISIDLKYYENKNFTRIIDKASQNYLRNILPLKKTTTLKIVSIDSIITSNLMNISIPTYKELYYYGCVYKYWPMFSYEAYSSYISATSEFENSFPLLAVTISELKRQYECEYKLLHNMKIIDVDFYQFTNKFGLELQINELSLVNNSNIASYNLRIVFDLIHVEDALDLIYLKTVYNEQFISIYKTKKKYTTEYSLMVRKFLESFEKELDDNFIYLVYNYINMSLVVKICSNNVHEIHCKLYNNTSTNIIKIVELCKTILTKTMNSVSAIFDSINSNRDLVIINISATLIWSGPAHAYAQFPKYYSEHIKCGLISYNNNNNAESADKSNDLNHYEFVFRKGIDTSYKSETFANYQEEGISPINEFDYLSMLQAYTHWSNSICVGQMVNVYYNLKRVQFELLNITPINFNTIFAYIYDLTINIIKFRSSNVSSEKVSSTVSLKSLDPHLYTRLIDDKLYSRICQKKYQPTMVFELNNVPKRNLSKYIKYYNFTTKSTVYYNCPNPKYPNFSFLTGIHTQDYCVPCCKKKGNFIPKVYSTCLKEHQYVDTDKLTKKSRYIINYGKAIEYRRLSQLPDIIKSYFSQYAQIISNNFLPDYFNYNDKIVPIENYLHIKPKMVSITELDKYLDEKLPNSDNVYREILDSPDLNLYVYNLIKNQLLQPLIGLKVRDSYHLLWNPIMLAKYKSINSELVPLILLNNEPIIEKKGGNENSELINNNGLYLYGNAQYYNSMSCGTFYCLAEAMETTIESIFEMSVRKLTSNVEITNMINLKYECDIIDLLSHMNDRQSIVPLNKIGMLIAYYLFKINMIVFYFKGDNCKLKCINRSTELEYPIMLIFRKVERYKSYFTFYSYYIIAYCNLKQYFKSQQIERMLFRSGDIQYIIITNMLSTLSVYDEYNLFYKFLTYHRCKVLEYYTNNRNARYMCKISWNDKILLVPIPFQLKGDLNDKLLYTRSDVTISRSELMDFLNLYDKYLVENGILHIRFNERRDVIFEDNLIGTIVNGKYYYYVPHKANDKLYENAYKLFYNPDIINKLIGSKSITNVDISRNLYKYYYDAYLYYLFCIQVVFNVSHSKLHLIQSPNQLRNYFSIKSERDIVIRDFPNTMLSCLSNMPYCSGSKLIISEKDFDYYSKLFLYEYNKKKIIIPKLLAHLINNFFKFNINQDENLYILLT